MKTLLPYIGIGPHQKNKSIGRALVFWDETGPNKIPVSY